MRITAPHPGMQSKPGTTLKPAGRPAGINDEMTISSYITRTFGNHLPAKDESFSNITGAIAQKEALVSNAEVS